MVKKVTVFVHRRAAFHKVLGKNMEDFEDKWQFIFRLLEEDLSLLVPAYVHTKQLRGVSVHNSSGTTHAG